MLKMERILVLQILDEAWKNHLLVMDHLKGSVGLRGYAQVDPKVEYKREGMRTFEAMWDSVGSRVTDFVFRMEQLPEDFVSSTWAGAEARHEEVRLRPARSRSSSRRRSKAPNPATSASRSATATRKSAATNPVRAAAAKSTSCATEGRVDGSEQLSVCRLSLRESFVLSRSERRTWVGQDREASDGPPLSMTRFPVSMVCQDREPSDGPPFGLTRALGRGFPPCPTCSTSRT